jgi:glutaminyl-tRNA synthetase
VIYIERDDFMERPPKEFFRLSPGREVRLRYAYIIKCVYVVKDKAGEVVELHCIYDPETRSGAAGSSRKVKGTIHWVSATHALKAEARLYDRLFTVEDPGSADDFESVLNPDSLETVTGYVEPGLSGAVPGSKYQFERLGYFCVDEKDSSSERLVFNRTVSLRDTWAKIAKKL